MDPTHELEDLREQREIQHPSLDFALLAPKSYKRMTCNVKEQQNSFSHNAHSLRSWESTSIWNVSAEIYVWCLNTDRKTLTGSHRKSFHSFSHLSVICCILTRTGGGCCYKICQKCLLITVNSVIQHGFSSRLVFLWPVDSQGGLQQWNELSSCPFSQRPSSSAKSNHCCTFRCDCAFTHGDTQTPLQYRYIPQMEASWQSIWIGWGNISMCEWERVNDMEPTVARGLSLQV